MPTFQVFVRVGGRNSPLRAFKRFPVGTSAQKIREWRESARTELRKSAPKAKTPFEEDVETYLATVAALPTIKERTRDMAIWAAVFGELKRHEITPAMIRAQRDAWLTVGPRMRARYVYDREVGKKVRVNEPVKAPLAASTVNHRLRGLENFYTIMNGRRGENPVREVPEAREPDHPPRAIPPAIVDAIFRRMPDSMTRARLRVMAETGIPPATLMRIAEADLNLKAKTVWVPGRAKGEGTVGRIMPLTTAGAQAFRELKRWGAFGPFSTAAVRQCWLRACRALKITPAPRPYDLRHSFGTRAYLAVGPRTAQLLMGHSTPALTERYARAAVDPHLQAAVRRIEQAGRKKKGKPKKRKTKARAAKRGRRPTGRAKKSQY